MDTVSLWIIACLAWMGVGVAVFILLFFVRAPYGRYSRGDWGPRIPARWAWFIMEIVSPLTLLGWVILGVDNMTPLMLLAVLLWVGHYLYRSVIYPLRMPASSKPMPLSVMVFALIFNGINASLNGWGLSLLSTYSDESWLGRLGHEFGSQAAWIILGVGLFLAGFLIHMVSDASLRRQKQAAAGQYVLPKGGLYRLVSSPNYFGEIVQWLGWAVISGSLAAVTFALWTVFNLAPRAWHHHRWYRQSFPELPRNRRALIPYLW